MSKLKKLRTILERKKGAKSILQKQIKDAEVQIKDLKRDIDSSERAQIIIQTVAQSTQKQLEYRVGELVSLAQASVFDDPWNLKLNFVLRRGQSECDLLWEQGKGRTSRNLNFNGAGGEEDVGGEGLRFALWNLKKPRSRATFFLDEPLTALKGDVYPERGSQMIKEISKKIGLQIIMITHMPDLTIGADKVFKVKKINGISEVTTIE